MALYLKDGKLLEVGGKLAAANPCCCDVAVDCESVCAYKFGVPEADEVLIALTMDDSPLCPDLPYLLLSRGPLYQYGPYLDCWDLPETPDNTGSWGLQCYWTWHLYCQEFELPEVVLDHNNSISAQFSIASYVWTTDPLGPRYWWLPSIAVVFVRGGYLSPCPNINQGQTNFLLGDMSLGCPPLSGPLTSIGCAYGHCVEFATYVIGGSIP